MATSPFIARSAYGTFIFFGCLTVIGFLYVLFFVPETKGRTLEEMDEAFGDVATSKNDLARQAEINKRVGLDAYASGTKTPEDIQDEKVSEKEMDA